VRAQEARDVAAHLGTAREQQQAEPLPLVVWQVARVEGVADGLIQVRGGEQPTGPALRVRCTESAGSAEPIPGLYNSDFRYVHWLAPEAGWSPRYVCTGMRVSVRESAERGWQGGKATPRSWLPGLAGTTVRAVRPSSRVAFAVAWVVYAVTVVLAWRKVLAVPDGRGDVNGLLVATVAGFFGLALLAAWLRDYENR
jgi:hypothetical protein